MKLAYVTVASIPSRTAHAAYAANLCDALGRGGADILLFGSTGPLDAAQHRRDFPRAQLETIGWPALTRFTYLKLAWMMLVLWWRGPRWQADRVFVTHNEALAALFILQGRAFVFDMHAFGPAGRLLRFVLGSRRCLGCIFSAQTVAHAFAARVMTVTKPTLVLGSGVDAKQLQPRGSRAALRRALKIDDDRIVAAYVGSMGRARGIDLMLQAAASRKFPLVFWLFVGGRPDDVAEWRRQAYALGLGDKAVHFAGFQRQECLGDWYAVADVLCAPYRRAVPGWDYVASMKLLEYRAVGKYAVVAAMPYAREVLSPQTTAFFDPDAAGGFDAALAAALEAIPLPSYRPVMALDNDWDAKAGTLLAWMQTIARA